MESVRTTALARCEPKARSARMQYSGRARRAPHRGGRSWRRYHHDVSAARAGMG